MRKLAWISIAAAAMAGSGALAQSEVRAIKANYSVAEGIGAEKGAMRREHMGNPIYRKENGAFRSFFRQLRGVRGA